MSGDKMVIFFRETDHPTGGGGGGDASSAPRRVAGASGVYAAKTIKGFSVQFMAIS